jgi:hypothetical protein
MKMVKSLVLGSSAALLAMGGAQAADLPVKAKAVEYVRICSLYGAGFYYIPGTDTCIKLGGYLRAEIAVNTNSVYTGNTNLPASAFNRMTNAYTWRSREDLNIDTRTATEYGVVRTFFDATFTWTTDSYTQSGTTPGSTVYSQIGALGAGQANNGSSGLVAQGTLGVYYAFIQFAGFTMGKAISTFSAPWTNYPGNNFDGLVGGGGTVTGVNQFTYTANFGNGVSASISAQDQTQYYQAGVLNVSAGGAFGTSDYANTIAPDVVGTLQVDQAWGLAKLSVAAHDNHVAYYGATEPTGHPDDRWGWAVQGALSIKADAIAPGDVFNVQAVYTDGATRYNIQDLAGAAGAAQIYGSSGVAYQSVGFGVAPDTVFGNQTSQKFIQTWGFRGGYTHNWNPYWNTSIYGAYAGIRYSNDAKSLICGGVVDGIAFGGSFRTIANAAAGGITTCNPDYNIAQAGIVTRWTPVKNLTFSADLTWTGLDQKMAGFVTAANGATFKPAVAYELRDQNTIQLLLRAQRNW